MLSIFITIIVTLILSPFFWFLYAIIKCKIKGNTSPIKTLETMIWLAKELKNRNGSEIQKDIEWCCDILNLYQ